MQKNITGSASVSVSRTRVAWCLCICLMFSIFIPGAGNNVQGAPLREKFQSHQREKLVEYQEFHGEPYYSQVMDDYLEKGYKPAQETVIEIDYKSITASDKGDIPVKDNIGGKAQPVLVWQEDHQWFEWSFDVSYDGLYEIHIEYYTLTGSGNPIERALLLNDEVPFEEAYNIKFPRMWQDDGEPRFNSIGDQVRPKQIELEGWRTAPLTDSQGMYPQPFQFYLTKGRHRLRLEYIDQDMAIDKIIIKTPELIPSYAQVQAYYEEMGYTQAKETQKFQAETHVTEKSDPTVRRESNGDPAAEPVTPGSRLLNVIGGWRWRRGNQSITWEFTVPEDGLYNIGLRIAQTWGDGLPVYRQIAIDGKVPFKELLEYKFEHNRDWRFETLKDKEDNPYLFYLTKGTHKLTMTVKLGPLTEVIQLINDDALLLSRIIRQIIMITGNEPDVNYDYELEKSIPDLIDNLQYLSDRMQDKVDILTALSSKRPAMANNFNLIKDQLQGMIRRPDTIPRKLNDLNNALTSLGSWYLTLKDHPLLIDYFYISAPDEKLSVKTSNFFEKAWFTWSNFIRSFTKDYDNIGSIYATEEIEKSDMKVINVWISRGMEWGEVMKEMADEQFTPQSGVYVNMNMLPPSQLEAGAVNALLLAINSGRAPDVAIGVGASSPVEFAIRDAVADLKQFEDYEKVVERFQPGIMIPYEYRGGIYALPETMDFSALFYRTDIIEELGIEIPDTWEDVYQYVLPILYQNGMQFYYPPGGFAPFLFQNEGSYYNEQGTKSGLDTPEAYQAFKEFTELYTSYGIPEVANFFNRMRTGEMPMGVGGYSLYIQLSIAAPELTGRWAIAKVPGHKKEDGTIDRTVGGIAAQAAMIINQSEHKKEAWEFLKWWTDTPAQVQFGKELEALIGVEARWNTANKEAFNSLPWNRRDLPIINEQLNFAKDMPVVLGGYFTGRHVNNAWNRVVLGNMNVRDSLEQAVKDINVELRRKQEEYGFKVSDE